MLVVLATFFVVRRYRRSQHYVPFRWPVRCRPVWYDDFEWFFYHDRSNVIGSQLRLAPTPLVWFVATSCTIDPQQVQGRPSLYPVGAACAQWKMGRIFFLMRVFTEIRMYDSLRCNVLNITYLLYWAFDQLFLRKVIKTDNTRCLDFSWKCTEMLRPDPLRELTPLPQIL